MCSNYSYKCYYTKLAFNTVTSVMSSLVPRPFFTFPQIKMEKSGLGMRLSYVVVVMF